MKKFGRKVLATAVMAFGLGVGSLSASAATFEDFTVNEGSVPGTPPSIVVADKINGGYSERITFDGAGGFATNAFADFGQFFANEGTVLVPSQLGTSYNMYALFTSDGSVAPIGPGLFQFTGNTGAFDLFIDPNQDTTKTLGATGSDPITLGNTGDDYRIAFASDLTSASGVLVAGVGGFFDLVFDDFTLTSPEGTSYFISPDPFYLRVNVDGDFDSFAVAGTQTLTGDVSAVFQLPEPTLPALLGMVGLIGFGFSRSRGQRR